MVAATQPDDRAWIEQEIAKCAASATYFIDTYCQLYDNESRSWMTFKLWAGQVRALNIILSHQQTIVLKARQIGLSWLELALIIWEMLFRPIATVLVFSKTDDEAMYLLGEERLKGMYYRLPLWMQARQVTIDSAHTFALSNGSIARAFPNTRGDGYSATHLFIDEADLLDLGRLMRSAKPTIDAGGKMVVIGRADKSNPNSLFKNIYRAAKEGRNDWGYVFLAWYERPGRTSAWYQKERESQYANTGSDDSMWEQYPATDVEALASRTLDKRFAPEWVLQCYVEQQPYPLDSLPEAAPSVPELKVYVLPDPKGHYCIGVDTAEGNPTSDDTAILVLDQVTGEEVATLSGKFQPSTTGAYVKALSAWYSRAEVMVERNNHGHTVILWLQDNARSLNLAWGLDDKVGWLSNSAGKTHMYNKAADYLRFKRVIIHSFKAYTQLASINGSSLRAPEGDMDDVADAFVLASQLVGVVRKVVW